jgi:hypothetical protein
MTKTNGSAATETESRTRQTDNTQWLCDHRRRLLIHTAAHKQAKKDSIAYLVSREQTCERSQVFLLHFLGSWLSSSPRIHGFMGAREFFSCVGIEQNLWL